MLRRLLWVVGLIALGATGVVLVGGVPRGSLSVASADGARAMISPVGVQAPPGQPRVLAIVPPVPSYWPTASWRTASPASQGMDGKRLDAMLAEIRSSKLPLDRHFPGSVDGNSVNRRLLERYILPAAR